MSRRSLTTARGIVLHNDCILLMERWRTGTHYFSIPGGHIEAGESPEQTVVREIMEETGVTIQVDRPVFYCFDQQNATSHVFYLCNYISGDPQLPADSEEFARSGTHNQFHPGWIKITDVPQLPFGYWQTLQHPLSDALRIGFGVKPVEVVLQSSAR